MKYNELTPFEQNIILGKGTGGARDWKICA